MTNSAERKRPPSKRANGEGSLYARVDGMWVGAAYVLTPSGDRRRRVVYGKTRQQAHEKLTELLRRTQQGMPTTGDSRTVGVWLDHWLEQVAKPRLRPSTHASYTACTRLHIRPALGNKRLDRLTAADVRAFLAERQASGLSATSVRYLHAIVRSALEQAVRDDLVPRNVARLVQPPTVRRAEIRPLDPTEAKKFLAANRDDRLFALWSVALALGLRRGEALGLAWSDVDLDHDSGHLRVRQALQRIDGALRLVQPKSAKSVRTIPLPALCIDALRAHRARQAQERLSAGPRWRDSGLVFTTSIGTPIEPRNLTRSFNEALDRAGLRHVRLHDLRHTCASLLLAQGVQPRTIMETLGHSTIAVTLDIYSHVLPAVQRDAADRMDALLSG